ncbi:MAG: hypothetical protein ACHQIH_05205 [Ignavibacteria bacterium]
MNYENDSDYDVLVVIKE